MKIPPLNCTNISFKAGKTVVYSDFDGTFMPYSHSDVCNNGELSRNGDKINNFNNIYRKFIDFSNKTGDKFKLILSTGRNLPELEFILSKIKKQKLTFPQINSVIVKNGGDRYDYNYLHNYVLNNEKSEAIKKSVSGWDSDKIKYDLKNIIKTIKSDDDKDLIILNVPINKHEMDYEKDSLECIIKRLENVNKKYYASFSEDGTLAIDLVFPPNIKVDNIKKAINDYFADNKIQASVLINNFDGGYPVPAFHCDGHMTVGPSQTIQIKPLYNGKALNKLYDVKEEVKKNIAEKSDDLVIAAGDGINDEPMLNIFNYLDLYGIEIPEGKNIKELIEDKEILNAIKALPLAVIVVGLGADSKELLETARLLESKGIKKFFVEENAKNGLLNKIKESMLSYSNENENYKYSLGADVFKEIIKEEYEKALCF